jgi:hypothetical protein
MKPWKTNKPIQPKVYKLSVKDIEIYRENMSNVSQLIAVAANHIDRENETLPGLKDQLQNSIKFLDDMRFLFLKLASADAMKIEREGIKKQYDLS